MYYLYQSFSFFETLDESMIIYYHRQFFELVQEGSDEIFYENVVKILYNLKVIASFSYFISNRQVFEWVQQYEDEKYL